MFTITHPAATAARGIENLLIYGERSNFLANGACEITARLVSTVVFPIILTLELIFLRMPKLLLAIRTEKCQQKADKVFKYFLAICPSIIFGLYSPEAVPGFFLKRPKTDNEILPFGVEHIFGTSVKSKIQYPRSEEEVCDIVTGAKSKGSQVSVIGAGMSQGTQTLPIQEKRVVIHTKHLDRIEIDGTNNMVTVGAGTTWEKLQLALDKVGKSAIVKQASDIFSIGGSIGINCHGWAHAYGAISKTVRSLKIVDAEGQLRVLNRPNEDAPFEHLTDDEKLFKCMFGTLGYFGVVVEATLDIVDNVMVQEKAEEIDLDQFTAKYETIKNNPQASLFGGKLTLDTLNGDPLRKICMVSYHETPNQPLTNRITQEPEVGQRLERIGLELISHLSNFSAKRLLSYFWEQEKTGMFSERQMTRNQALHPPINAFKMLHESDRHAQWLQEYFIEPDKLANFIRFLGAELKANDVRLVNATIRPTPKDTISILPYAEKDRCAVVICFAQQKTAAEIEKTKRWIENVNAYLVASNGVFYQAYMPYATREQFEACYGADHIAQIRILKQQFDPHHVFGNAHTAKYYDPPSELGGSVHPTQHSSFRAVFGSQDSRDQFAHFLNTMFYQLDDQKVFAKMDEILADQDKTDEQIYKELVEQIDQMEKPFSMRHQLTALSVLLKGMGVQAARLLKGLRPEEFHNYAEIYFKKYLRTIQKTAQLPLNGQIFTISDQPSRGTMKEKLEADSLFRSYPSRMHVPLNDEDCQCPEEQVDKTYKPLEGEIQEGSLDLVSALGGFHHTPRARIGPFVDLLRTKLRPGGVLLLRDHNVTSEALRDMVSVVHSFVNAGDKMPWAVEAGEIREFQNLAQWTDFMQSRGFVRISNEELILQDDPTQNAMLAFARKPDNLEELQIAARFRKDSVRSLDSTRATWIEWGNVRYSKQFAQFIQSKHAYAFDYLSHLNQHWKYFTTYIKESRKDLSLRKIVLSDNFSLNIFILTATAFQCITGYLGSLPNAALARVTKGVNWRNATDLTALEKEQAKIEEEYSNFIDHTPFYMFSYVSKISGLWGAIWNSNETLWTKGSSYMDALLSTIKFLFKAAICGPIQIMYTQNGQSIEPDKIGILVHDPKNQFLTGPKQIKHANHPVHVVYETDDHYKLVLVPRYRAFTDLCKELANNQASAVQLVEIGSQTKITVDVMYSKDDPIIPEEATLIYEMDKLQDEEQSRFATYEVNVNDLTRFIQAVGADKIEYIHE